MNTARVYVGTYAKYNSGSIAGEWLDLSDFADKDDFLEKCAEIHSDESDPEFMFQDHEGIPAGMIGESHISESAFTWAGLDEDEQNLISAYSECFGEHYTDWDDIDSALSKAQDKLASQGQSLEDYAYDLMNETMDIPDNLKNYIDYSAFARDLEMGGDLSTAEFNGETWIFWIR